MNEFDFNEYYDKTLTNKDSLESLTHKDSLEINYFIKSNNNYISDYILKLPYDPNLDIYNDIIEKIYFKMGTSYFTIEADIYILEIYNYLFGKKIKIIDNYLYLPITTNINALIKNSFKYNCYELKVEFKSTYIDYLKKINQKYIELLYKEYITKKKYHIEAYLYDKSIHHVHKFPFLFNIEGDIDSIKSCKLNSPYKIFSLFIYGIDKDDISDVQLVLSKDEYVITEDNNNYNSVHETNSDIIYDMILKEIRKNIYILEFADPLLFDSILDEPLSSANIFNKKTIDLAKFNKSYIKFKKTNNKNFQINIVALYYNHLVNYLNSISGLLYSN